MSEFLQPRNLDEALAARAAHPGYQLLAGGTDLLVASKDRPAPEGTIDLFGLPELTGISESDDGYVRIGAATTYAQILSHALVGERYPLLRAACREVGAAQIQARGTIGGNMATSSPVGDTLPALLALDAEIELCSTAGPRRIPYRNFLIGYRKIDLAPDELIAAVHLPRPPRGALQVWRKVGTRRAQSISKVMMAALGHVEEGLIAEARIGLGAVAERGIRARATEEALVGQPADEASAGKARQALRAEIAPISDLRSEAAYRLRVAENLVARFVMSLRERAES